MGPWFKTSLMLLLAVMPGGLFVLLGWALWGAWQRGGIPALRLELRRRLAPLEAGRQPQAGRGSRPCAVGTADALDRRRRNAPERRGGTRRVRHCRGARERAS